MCKRTEYAKLNPAWKEEMSLKENIAKYKKFANKRMSQCAAENTKNGRNQNKMDEIKHTPAELKDLEAKKLMRLPS